MADKLEWMEQHPVLLRDNYWHYAEEKLAYKVRPDLAPLFERYPEVLPLLYALRDKKDYSVACDLMARMLHPRVAVWWGYVCLLSLLEERKERAVKGPTKPESLAKTEAMLKELGVKIPQYDISAPDFKAANMQTFSIDRIPKIPKPSMNDPAAAASSKKIQGKAEELRKMIPPFVREKFEAGKKTAEDKFKKKHGFLPMDAYRKMQDRMMKNPMVTYNLDYNSKNLQLIEKSQKLVAADLDAGLAKVKAQFPEKFPPTPEAAMLFAKADEKKSTEAIQAVYQWVVAPDEVNSQLAMDAGNKANGKPEGLLALTAFWSFGDLAPQGKIIVPTPPQLAPTGLANALLMMSLEPGGPRESADRWKLYFDLGIDAVMARNLWPNALVEELAPHEKIRQEPPQIRTPAGEGPAVQTTYKRWK